MQLASPDYNYFQWPWYREPRDEGHPFWTEPYFDDGGGNTIMTTYSRAVSEGSIPFWGIATIDIAMTQLIEETKQIAVGKTGYAFIITKSGRFIAFPDTSRIMKSMLQDSNPVLAVQMMGGQAGFRRTQEAAAAARRRGSHLSQCRRVVFRSRSSIRRREVLAEAFDLAEGKLQLALGIIGLVALFMALVVVARSISKPITQLASAAREVAQEISTST